MTQEISTELKFFPYAISIREPASKSFVDNKFIDPCKIKNTDHVDFNDNDLDNVHSIRVNSFPTPEEQLTPKICVNQAYSDSVDEPSLLRVDLDEKLRLDEQDSISLNFTLTSAKTIINPPTKFYVDIKFNNPSIIKNTAHVDSNDKNLDNVRFIKVNSMPAVGEHLTAKYYVVNAILFNLDESSLLKLDLQKN